MAGTERTIHIFLGTFLLINFCIGVGFLGMPYVFFYSGYLAAVPMFFIILTLGLINAIYLLEVMARAQALEDLKAPQEMSCLDPNIISAKPRFEVTSRKFEMMELCEIFFNKWVKYLYTIILVANTFLILWAFCTVGGSSWALNIPYNFSGVVKCESDAFLHSILPVEVTCRNAYYFSLFIFALIVVPLSVLDLKEQAVIQMLLGLTRFLLILAIVIYSIASIIQGGNTCTTKTFGAPSVNFSDVDTINMFDMSNNTSYIEIRDIVLKFDPKGWLTSVPVILSAISLHQAISTMIHPIRQKKYLHHLMIIVFGIIGVVYLSLGVIVPLLFKADIQETVTLNFTELTYHSSLALRSLAYCVILFPTLDAASAYPLVVHVAVNHIYAAIVGHDTSIRPSSHKTKWLMDIIFRISLRLIMAILPIVAAFFISNLVYIMVYAGLITFFTSLFFPTALQLFSIYECKKVFAPSGQQGKKEKQLLLQENSKLVKRRSEYMTPFSSQVFSHPITVVIVGILDVCAFVLGVASIFVSPTELSCL